MKLAGHTMGTPDLTLAEAFALFHQLGYDGVEVVWQDGYRSAVHEDETKQDLGRIRQLADDLELEIHCLTPYMTQLSSLDDGTRDRDMHRFRRCMAAASVLGARRIRVYAGSRTREDGDIEEKRHRLLAALRELGDEAHTRDVVLCVENHFNTFAATAAQSVELVRAVGSPGVGILYDQANLSFTHAEPWQEAIALQSRWIRHVQAKDFVFTDPDAPFVAGAVEVVREEERTVRSRVLGEGILDWPAIIATLREAGYDGFVSVEYEYRWHPGDLPEPSEGFRRSIEYMRPIVVALSPNGLQVPETARTT